MCVGKIGFLDELPHRSSILHVADCTSATDVAESGFWPVGNDPEGDNRAARRSSYGAFQRRGEGSLVGHRLIGWRDGQNGIGTVFLGVQGGQGHGRCGVAPEGFEQQHRWGKIELAKLVKHQKSVVFVADNARRTDVQTGASQTGDALCSLLEQTSVAVQNQELLGVLCTRQRPQPGSTATGHDDGANFDDCQFVLLTADAAGVVENAGLPQGFAGFLPAMPSGFKRCQRHASTHIASRLRHPRQPKAC